jgi:hypothetical protein
MNLMVTHTLRLVRILWTAVGSVDEALRLVDADSDVGLYQIYGTHVVFEGRIATWLRA